MTGPHPSALAAQEPAEPSAALIRIVVAEGCDGERVVAHGASGDV
jgi:hypothetical protein